MLLGDAAQHHSSLRRKAIMKQLNPQLQALIKEGDFKEAQPGLFGEDFGEKAKAKLETAAALKNPSTHLQANQSRRVLGEASPVETTGASRLAGQTTTALEDHHGKISDQQAADKKRIRND